MIVVNVEVVTEAGAADKVRAAVQTMEQATRHEVGCLTYAFSVDISDPTLIRVTERWESLEAIRAHMASPHMATFQRAIAALEPKSLDIKAYEVAREVALG
ncbi:MAG: antibiotic biosynthesis monooxygenase [Deltaproteobacteria bacterium]|nr:antibiotic biosynthesis monooxygenase [Deltaproteobacteria bacterium]